MYDKLQVHIWSDCEVCHGEIWEREEGAEYRTAYTTESTSCGNVMVNIALYLIRNATEEIR